MRFLIIFLCLGIYVLTSKVSAQDEERIANLWKEYDAALDTQKVNYLVSLSRKYIGHDNARGLELAQRAYYFADSIGFRKGLPKAKGFIALYLEMMGEIDSAFALQKEVAKEFEELGNWLWAGYGFRNIGLTYQQRGNYVLALDYMLRSLEIREKLRDTITIMETKQSIAFLHDRQGNDLEAIELNKEVLALAQAKQDSYFMSRSYQGIGIALDDLGRYEEALAHNLKALEISQLISDQDSRDVKYLNATNKGNIGNNYFHLGDNESALKYTLEAYKEDSTNNEPDGLVNKAINLGSIYLKLGDHENAKKYLDEGYALARYLKSNQRMQEVYHGYCEYYLSLGLYQNAIEWLEKYVTVNDSTFNEQVSLQFAEMRSEFDLVKKEQQLTEKELAIAEQSLIIKQNQNSIIGLVCVLVFGSILGLSFFKRRQYQMKLKHESEKTFLKSAQIEAVISSQEKERKRFAMDLHDGFGQLISALKLNVSSLTTKEAKKSEEILDSMYSSLKNIAFDLMPHTLFEKGLEEAIEELIEQVNSSGSLKMTFQSFGISGKISDEQKIAVYRIVQELVSNIIKYADASKINISLTDVGAGFSLLIEDNGAGYNLETFKNSNGNGWKNIHSRLDLLDGEIDFDTIAGRKNSTVSIEIPYKVQVKSAIA